MVVEVAKSITVTGEMNGKTLSSCYMTPLKAISSFSSAKVTLAIQRCLRKVLSETDGTSGGSPPSSPILG